MAILYWSAELQVSDYNLSKFQQLDQESGTSSSVAAMNPRWLAPEAIQVSKHSTYMQTWANTLRGNALSEHACPTNQTSKLHGVPSLSSQT